MAAPKKNIDRVRLGVDYRAGVKSLRTMGKEYGLSASRISQLAAEEGWERDLSIKIREKVKVKLNKSILNSEGEQCLVSTEKEVVDANAEMQLNIILGERALIVRLRELVKLLLKELEETTGNPEEFVKLGELMEKPDTKGIDKLNEIYHRVIAMPQRVDSLKKLAEVLKTLIGLERQAFNIDEAATLEDPLTQVLNEVAKRRRCLVKEASEDGEE